MGKKKVKEVSVDEAFAALVLQIDSIVDRKSEKVQCVESRDMRDSDDVRMAISDLNDLESVIDEAEELKQRLQSLIDDLERN